MVNTTVEQLAQKLSGEIRGDARLRIDGAESIGKAGPNHITYATDDKNVRKVAKSRAGACIVSRTDAATQPEVDGSLTWIVVDDPLDAFIAVLREFRPLRERSRMGISADAIISPDAQIGSDCNIFPGVFIDEGVKIGARCELYPGVYIGRDCRIGNDCILHPHVVLYPDVSVGDRTIIHASAVLGADGFGYRMRDGRFEKIPQLGWVQVQADCEIGACTTIDRGMIGPTIVGEGTKLDNLVMIAHNCELGKHNAFASQTGLAGSVTTGDFVRCAGQVGVADHLHLGAGCMLMGKSGVYKNVPAGENQIGSPARSMLEQARAFNSLTKVPDMRKKIENLEQRLEELTRQFQELAACQ